MSEALDTIFALSTPKGRSALAVIRLSGPASEEILRSFTKILPIARRATLATLRDPVTDEIIDRSLVLWLPGPGSFTGEDMVELHLHGGLAVIQATIGALGKNPRCRVAFPGEFTRRAFENGRLDLTAAEGIADLIDAETEAQRRQALAQVNGGLANKIENWKERLVGHLAHVEALIDFSDEGVPEIVVETAKATAGLIQEEIAQELHAAKRGEIIREGVSIAIIGPPNSGKSSLLNRMAGRDVALVSSHAGTTRDVIEVFLNLNGFSVCMADTAGIRESLDPLEEQGISRARIRAKAADIKVLLLDATKPEEEADFDAFIDDRTLKIWNKSDLACGSDSISISSKTGEGLDNFLRLLEKRIDSLAAGPPSLVTRARHREALELCSSCLASMFHVKQEDAELLAEDLRVGVRALGSITGSVSAEDLLDMIFRDFCIGK